MTEHGQLPRVVRASRDIAADAARIFELIADPAQQPSWDGNDNLAEAAGGQRVRHVGDVFTMTLSGDGAVRENQVVEFEEGRRIAWRPAEPGQDPPGTFGDGNSSRSIRPEPASPTPMTGLS